MGITAAGGGRLTLHLLRRPQVAFEDQRNAGLAAAGVWLALVFLLLFLSQRWRLAKSVSATAKNWSAW